MLSFRIQRMLGENATVPDVKVINKDLSLTHQDDAMVAYWDRSFFSLNPGEYLLKFNFRLPNGSIRAQHRIGGWNDMIRPRLKIAE